MSKQDGDQSTAAILATLRQALHFALAVETHRGIGSRLQAAAIDLFATALARAIYAEIQRPQRPVNGL